MAPEKQTRERFSRLLIVEDNRSQLRTLTSIMKNEGFEVVGCSTATEALEQVRKNEFGIAVVDLRLPDLSGTQLLEQIRLLDRSIQVIINTAHGSFDSAKDAVNQGAFAYVEKGSCPEDLVRRVHAASRWYLDRYARELEEAVEAQTSQLRQANQTLTAEVAEHKRTVEALHGAKRIAEAALRAKGAFLANMGHELRTPLNGVIEMTDLLLHTELSPEQRPLAEAARRFANALVSLVDDALNFSKLDVGPLAIQRAPFDLSGIVSEVAELLASQAADKGIELRVRYEPGAPRMLFGDPDHIRQVILNLASNGLKFTKEGSVSIEVECERREDEEALMRIAVEDTGLGIAADALERIFDAFTQVDASTTRRLGGTGLGLAITKRLVEIMGGCIGVRSRVGEGSSFWVSLPLSLHDPTASLPAGLPVHRASPRPVHYDADVLVVEDIAVNQLVVVRMLTKLGCQADVAANGREALRAMARKRYDLVLMDCQMPKMDGFAATAEIRRREAAADAYRVPIVAMTARTLVDDGALYLQAGMDDYLAKPVKQDSLRRAIARWVSAVEEE